MRAMTVVPGTPGSARVDDVPDPSPHEHALLVRALRLAPWGTDRESAAGVHAQAPPPEEELIVAQESPGEVLW
jgi:hypothetical protein